MGTIVDASYENVPNNLAFLASLFPSIADVCRRIGMNRQQFNKYLNGTAFPSRRTMRRLCDFFGVTEAEILLHPMNFSTLVSVRRAQEPEHVLEPAKPALRSLLERSVDLSRYAGYYYRYFPSYGHPGKFVKALGHIGRIGSNYYWKCNEALTPRPGGRNHGFGKWHGVVLGYSDRLYLVEYDRVNATPSISSSIYYPCYRSRIDYLVGVQTGIPIVRRRNSAASRVVLEFIGKDVKVKDCLGRCGLFPPDHQELPPHVLKMLGSESQPRAYLLDVDAP